MARSWATLMVLCLLQSSGALAASLKAGGLTSSKWGAPSRNSWGGAPSRNSWGGAPSRGSWGGAPSRGNWGGMPSGGSRLEEPVMSRNGPVMRMGDLTMVGGRAPMINQGGNTAVDDGTGNSFSSGGITSVGGEEGPFMNEGGSTNVEQGRRRLLAERSIKAADARITAYGGRSSGFDVSGNPVVNMNGMYQSSQGVVRARGGSTWGYDDLGQPYQGQDTDVTFDRRRLAERSIKAADARITAYGGRSSGFDVSGNPVVNMNGMYQSSQGVVRARGGSTWGYDDLGQPYQGQDTDVTFD